MPAIWGGVECTRNRVGDRYFDQMDLSGHADRLDDYERIAAVGIRTLRVGLLWERHLLDPAWRWSDERLHRLRELGIRPIAGLLHHGSGPPHTSLLDPDFPSRLAAYAGSIAERYPWIDAYTPVNEPYTTARFSGLYGLWYPHHRSRSSCFRALLQQMKAVVLSMEAIRKVNRKAQLIQTEDFGAVRGTEALRGMWQALGMRRWLPFDLLYGRVDRFHPLFSFLVEEGLSEREVLWFRDHPCPPDVLGINYYPTSDRFLDHRTELYPEDRMSSEGCFVDVEAVRVEGQSMSGVGAIILEAWQRYATPTAITEVHLGGPVEEQIRWLAEAWKGIQTAKAQGANCVALTVWALFGSFYWNELVTRENGHYEAGVFDIGTGHPVATELADFIRQLTRAEAPSHPALLAQGWWQDDRRICYPHSSAQRLAA